MIPAGFAQMPPLVQPIRPAPAPQWREETRTEEPEVRMAPDPRSQPLAIHAENPRQFFEFMDDVRQNVSPVELTSDGLLKPKDLDGLIRLARLYHDAGLGGDAVKNWQTQLLLMARALALGFDASQANEVLYIVPKTGRITIFGDAVPALVLQSGKLEAFEERFDGLAPDNTFTEDAIAHCVVKRKDLKTPFAGSFSLAEARLAGLFPAMTTDKNTGRERPNYSSPWHRFTKRMLQMRARMVFRDAFADVMRGLSIAEEFNATSVGGQIVADVEPISRRAPGKSEEPSELIPQTTETVEVPAFTITQTRATDSAKPKKEGKARARRNAAAEGPTAAPAEDGAQGGEDAAPGGGETRGRLFGEGDGDQGLPSGPARD